MVTNLTLTACSSYVRTVVNDTEEADDPVDSDGQCSTFILCMFSFAQMTLNAYDIV